AGIRAGIPALVVPFLGDQPFWGWRLEKLGVGLRTAPRRQLTAERLADGIRRITTDPAMRARAAELGARVRAEGGLVRAVARIEQVAAGTWLPRQAVNGGASP
ncbi:MAG TPA: hypothetical protein VEB20_00235, partial [Azospirillaceae bacterium]|nr:hypothetical protein [Azospirillaceae bacterium]